MNYIANGTPKKGGLARPILVLSFFQTLAIYLLREYKGSMEDYKFFYLEARNRKRFMLSYMILRNAKAEQNIAKEILNDVVKQAASKDEREESGDSNPLQLASLTEILKGKGKE